MQGKTFRTLTSMLPEAWFDIIGRVVPGTVILILSVNGTWFSELGIGHLLIGLFVAYTVGFAFDICGFRTVGHLQKVLARCWPSIFIEDHQIWDDLVNRKRDSQALLIKVLAERKMFQTLSFYSLLQLIASMKPVEEYLVATGGGQLRVLPFLASGTMTVVFFSCWISMCVTLTEKYRMLLKFEEIETVARPDASSSVPS
ncbi:MAG: hypothetical protein KDA96_04725 [Planctomycetaceae bacterium]|nr:hypothetical protein [Planctomycetaceae bacterium]